MTSFLRHRHPLSTHSQLSSACNFTPSICPTTLHASLGFALSYPSPYLQVCLCGIDPLVLTASHLPPPQRRQLQVVQDVGIGVYAQIHMEGNHLMIQRHCWCGRGGRQRWGMSAAGNKHQTGKTAAAASEEEGASWPLPIPLKIQEAS